MSKKSISTFVMLVVLAGMLGACARKQQPETLAAPNALEEARARAAAEQMQAPVTPARSSTSSYIK